MAGARWDVGDDEDEWEGASAGTADGGASVTVVGLPKGGVGKTRLAMMSALYLAVREKRKVHVVDGDSTSQTAYAWQQHALKAGRDWPITVSRCPLIEIDEHIDDLRADNDEIIADVGGGNNAVFEAALTRAHRLLAPVGADPSETEKLPAAWKIAKLAAADNTVGGFEGYVVLSRTDHQTSLPREAREELTKGGINPETGKARRVYPVCDTELVKRVAYQRAYKHVPRDFLDVPALLREVGMVSSRRKGK
ncbi:ParA family protein [Streptomyces sp. NPDC001889]